MAERFKTGDISPYKAWYDWAGYTDGISYPLPTQEERRIPLEKGEKFPPIRSCNKGAYWVFSAMRY